MAEWWESDEKIHEESPLGIWWMGTKKNARNACPDWFSTNIGFSNKPIQEFISLGAFTSVAGGTKMPLNVVIVAGKAYERFSLVMVAAHSYCLGAYIGGGIDAAYQINNNGAHLSAGMTDWYMEKEKGVENFLINFYEWWRS